LRTYSGSAVAKKAVDEREAYRVALRALVGECAKKRAASLNLSAPTEPQPDEFRRKCERVVPAIAASVKGREFDLARHGKYERYMKTHPDALKPLGITPRQATLILNYVNGRRSIAEIWAGVAGEMDQDLRLVWPARWIRISPCAGPPVTWHC
jgi:hypothetical protein